MSDLENMHVSDIPSGLALCRKSGWNQLTRDWEYFLKYSQKDCLVVRSNHEVVGTVTCLRFQQAFSWISMVLVDPAFRGQGIGTFLLEQALQLLEREETVKLDATPEGRQVYVKFDFRDEYPLIRMMCSSFPPADSHSAVKSILVDDMERIKNMTVKYSVRIAELCSTGSMRERPNLLFIWRRMRIKSMVIVWGDVDFFLCISDRWWQRMIWWRVHWLPQRFYFVAAKRDWIFFQANRNGWTGFVPLVSQSAGHSPGCTGERIYFPESSKNNLRSQDQNSDSYK